MTFACLALTVPLIGGQGLQGGAAMGRVSGHVVEEGTITPVAGAQVLMMRDDVQPSVNGTPPSTVTDRDGRYQFDALPAGRYWITAQK